MVQKHVIPASVAALLAATELAAAQPQSQPTAAPDVQSGGFSLTTGLDYSTGKYGETSSTDILYVPLTGKYETDNWVFKVTVPYIVVSGPGNVVRGIGVVKNKAAGPRRTEEGLGDIIAGVSRNLLDIANTGTLVDLTGNIKFGTADTKKGLGTGENDYAAQVDVTQRITSAVSAFGSVGYRIIGSPAGAQLNNVVYAEGGGTVKLNDGLRLGAIFDTSQAPSSVSGTQAELTAYLTQQLSERWKLQVYGVHGFANGSPDWGGGAMTTFRF
jgi:hypothetical protein